MLQDLISNSSANNNKIFPKIDFNTSKLNTAYDFKDDSGKRFYRTPEGKNYPSVTTILSWSSAPAIAKWRKRIGAEAANKITTRAKGRGTALHKVCEEYLDNNENFLGKALPTTVDLFNPIKEFLDEEVVGLYCQEAALYSDYLRVAGRVDGIVKRKNGHACVIDFKTANKMKKESYITNYFMQTSAYCVMFEELTGIPVPNIAICMVDDEGQFKVFEKHRDDYIYDFIRLRKLYHEKVES